MIDLFSLPAAPQSSSSDPIKEPKSLIRDHDLQGPQITLFSRFDYTKEAIVKHYIQQLDKGDTDAFYIVNLSEIYNQYHQWKTYLPRIQPFYAVKCCPDPLVVRTLAEIGCSFDCASKAEIALVTDLGISSEKIVYANPVKGLEALNFAKSHGVDLMTFDNEDELEKIKKHYPKARLIIRIKTDDSGSLYKLSIKFGCSMEDVKGLLEKALSLDLKVVGVSFHIGSKCDVTDSWAPSLKDAREVIQIGRALGFNMNILDIGGGFPGASHDSKVSFEDMAAAINKNIDTFFHDVPDIKIIAEPGRYFCTKAYTVVFNVIGKKKPNMMEKETAEYCYYINEGIFGSFHDLIWEEGRLDYNFFEKSKGRRYKSVLYGPTLNELDVLYREIMLPELEVGDWIYLEEFGAYTRSLRTGYCSFPLNKSKYYRLI